MIEVCFKPLFIYGSNLNKTYNVKEMSLYMNIGMIELADTVIESVFVLITIVFEFYLILKQK